MAELIQAVVRTAYPDGRTITHQYGMMPTYRSLKDLSLWYRWLCVGRKKGKDKNLDLWKTL